MLVTVLPRFGESPPGKETHNVGEEENQGTCWHSYATFGLHLLGSPDSIRLTVFFEKG